MSKAGLNLTNDASKGGWRIGSYEFNRNLTAGTKKDTAPSVTGNSSTPFGSYITTVKPSTEVPVFFDSTWVDGNDMMNGTETAQPPMPPNLSGVPSATTASGSHCDH